MTDTNRFLWLTALVVVASLPSASAATYEHEIEVHEFGGGQYHLYPDEIRARVGDTLKINVTNPATNVEAHDIIVCGDGVKPDATCSDRIAFTRMLLPGESQTVTFTVEKVGTIEFFCDVFGHKNAGPGMKGVIIVQESTTKKDTGGHATLGLLAAVALAGVALRRR